jgi:hypothetical protein
MTVGFTGTRAGLSEEQARQLRHVLSLLRHADIAVQQPTLFLDGDCARGADRQARQIAEAHGCKSEPVPPKDQTAAELLARDRVIAQRCHILVAAPLTDTEQVRSGTWYTVRQARDLQKPVVMLTRGGRKAADEARLDAAANDECDRMAQTVAVEVLTRIDESVHAEMRAYLYRKMRDLGTALRRVT